MSTTFGITPARFVRQSSTQTAQNKTNYVSIMQNLLLGLQTGTWAKASAALGSVGMPQHDFGKGPYLGDQYDAYKMCGLYDSSTMKYFGYAGCVAYRFKVPDSYYGHYNASTCYLSGISIPVSRDRFLKTGYGIHLVASDSEEPSSDWGVIHADADVSGSDVTITRQTALASQSAVNYLVDALPLSGTVTVDATSKASVIASKKYIYAYLTLNDYTDRWTNYNSKEARLYAIEGAAAFNPTDFSFTWVDTNGIVKPDADATDPLDPGVTGDNQTLMKKIIKGTAGFVGAAAITVGALWYGGNDSDGDYMPDAWERSFPVLNAIDDPLERSSYAADGDLMAFSDIEGGLVVASNRSTGVCAPFMYDAGDNFYISLGKACSNLPVRVAFPYGDTLGVGSNATLGAEWVVTGFSRKRNFRLCHFQVYQKYGYEQDVATKDALRHTKAFTALDKYLLARFMLENGIGPGESNAVKNATSPRPFTTLVPGIIDYDDDGAPDGLELYMMFGPNAPSLSNNHLNPWDKSDGMSDYDGDGLTMSQEINGGKDVLNPWMIQSNQGGLIDKWADMYSIRRNDNSSLDEDGDGLSNLTEYLISKVFGFADISPFSKMTSGMVNDYFRKQGQLYFGEIFQDHDQVDDAWEMKYSQWASMAIYDPDRDDDDDGWGNYDEYMSGTHPGKQTLVGVDGLVSLEVPVPIFTMNLSYHGDKKLSGNIMVVATDVTTNRKEEAIWTLGKRSETDNNVTDSYYAGPKPSIKKSFHVGHNTIIEGTFKSSFKVLNYEIGSYENGEFKFEKYGDPSDAAWINTISDRGGKLYDMRHNDEVGTIDYENGLVSIDFTNTRLGGYVEIERTVVVTNSASATNAIEKTYAVRMNQDEAYVKMSWTEKSIPTIGRKTYYFSVADKDADGSYRFVRSGKHDFLVWDDLNANGEYDDGEPFGTATQVNVGFGECKFDVQLSDYHSFCKPFAFSDDIIKNYNFVNVKVIRCGPANENDYITMCNAIGLGQNIESRTILNKRISTENKIYLSEADFFTSTSFDVDYGNGVYSGAYYANNKVILPDGTIVATGSSVGYATNTSYLVVLYDGNQASTNMSPISCSAFSLRFDKEQSRPVCENVEAICYSARPTFRWSMPNESAWAKRFGTSYTAFKLQVYTADGVTKVYDSGVRRAAAQYKNGVFSWTADVSPGNLTGMNEFFATPGNYLWRVAMYNAKFQPISDTADRFSMDGSFSVAVNAQQGMNDHQYSTIDVAVKYAGPAIVLGHYTDLTTLEGKVRVQAFATADFAGEPLSETIVTKDVDAFASTVANVRLIGLDATGTYYIRAYIDSNGNHKRDEWESWGAAKEPIVLTTANVTAPLAAVWIEDCDVDQDWLPDAWEYEMFGTITQWNASVKPAQKTIFTTDMAASATTRLASLSADMNGTSLTIFENGAWATTLLGWGGNNNITFNHINTNVQHSVNIINNNFLVRSASLGANGVMLTINSDVAEDISGQMLNQYFFVTPNQARTTTVKVYRKNTYVDAEWTLFRTVTTQIGCTDRIKSVPVSGLSATSGIYKVVVE